ncbi:MAG TPA: NaeI family type II restriction endonuclease, partial [Deinococcales bacterium]|nr:NaeI family type II restriction endonuclease [Deinococcales bacterium]
MSQPRAGAFAPPLPEQDPALYRVRDSILNAAGPDPAAFFALSVRQAIDAVIDPGRTGRYLIGQLEKTEKTYIGTRIEIQVKADLEIESGELLDALIDGEEVDVKWSVTGASWEIPVEYTGDTARYPVPPICLVIGLRSRHTLLDVGLVRPYSDLLGGANRDQKRSITAAGKGAILWLVRGAAFGPSYLATLDDSVRDEIVAQPPGQPRVRKLFQLVQEKPIPRYVIETLALQRDPLRRT